MSVRTFVVAEETPGGSVRKAEHPNTATGHRKLCRRLAKTGRPVRICLEANGIYRLALALDDSRNVEVMVANPRPTKDFATRR